MTDQLTIKLSTEADRHRIQQLAQLDSRQAPHGDVLLAEINGRLVAAVGMDGSVIADPSERTAAVVKLLRAQVDGKPRRRARGRFFGRLVPAA
jgi:hypothetical protein